MAVRVVEFYLGRTTVEQRERRRGGRCDWCALVSVSKGVEKAAIVGMRPVEAGRCYGEGWVANCSKSLAIVTKRAAEAMA